MNEEKSKLIEILHQTKDISPIKYRRLQKLIVNYLYEYDPHYREKAHKKLDKFIYNLYLSCMTKETRSNITNTGVLINEECYGLEQAVNYKRENADEKSDHMYNITKNKGQWHVYFDGVCRLEKKDDGVIITDSIPREYKTGFYLNEDASATEKEFYLKHQSRLERISELMDRKQELTTYAYQTKNPFIPIKFVELLVDYLGLCKIPEEQKRNNK